MATVDVTAIANTAPYVAHTNILNHPCACHKCCLHMLTFGAAMVQQTVGSIWRAVTVEGKIQCVTSTQLMITLTNCNGNVEEFAAAVMARGLRALPRRTIGVSSIHVAYAAPKKARKRKSDITTTTPTKKPATTAKAMMPTTTTTTRRKTISLLDDDDETDPIAEVAAASSSTGGGGVATRSDDDDDDDDDNSDDEQDDDESRALDRSLGFA